MIDADPAAAVLPAFDRLGITATTYRHRPVFTVAEGADVKAGIPGAHTKNLFLKDRKDRLFLLTAREDAAVDLKRLHLALGASGRFSLGSAALMSEAIGVTPGSVTPLALMNDAAGRVTAALDASLLEADLVNVHPLTNAATTGLRPADLVAFLRAVGHEPTVIALPGSNGSTPAADCTAPTRRPS